jgi:hypothetical protein
METGIFLTERLDRQNHLIPLKKLGYARKRCELWDGLNITNARHCQSMLADDHGKCPITVIRNLFEVP